MNKKPYKNPTIIKVLLDNTISLVMMTTPPDNPPPLGSSNKSNNTPFASPFSDKPFN